MKRNIRAARLFPQEDSDLRLNGVHTTQGHRPEPNSTRGSQLPLKTAVARQRQTLLPSLSGSEREERNECEKTIRKGWETFIEVGHALATVRDKRLYRDQFRTFEEYCRQRWEFTSTHAYRMIEAAAVAAVLSPIGVKLKSESQARPLVGLPPLKIPAAWKRAEEMAGDGEVTAKVVRQAAEEFKTNSKTSVSAALTVKSSAIPPGLKAAFKLLYQAEEEARERDLISVLESLRNLRKCLLEFAQHSQGLVIRGQTFGSESTGLREG